MFAEAGAGSCTDKGENEMGKGIAGWCGVACSGAAGRSWARLRRIICLPVSMPGGILCLQGLVQVVVPVRVKLRWARV